MDIAVLNNSGSTILMGQVVYQTGFVQPQQVPSVALASAASTSTASALGLAVSDIADGAIGSVRISGNFSPIDTTSFLVNGKVYLSDTFGEISNSPGTIEVIVGQALTVDLSGCIRIACRIASGECSTSGSGSEGPQGATGIQGIQGVTGIGGGGGGGTGASNTLNMNGLGALNNAGPLPAINIGPELCGGPTTYVDFRGRRGTPGSAGTTTIQLEQNGTPIVGATLSWTPADGAFALKTVAISVAAAAGDRFSFRLTSRETGARDIMTEINA